MGKSRDDILRETLHPRERIVHSAEVHPSAYFLPIIIFISGICITFYPDYIINSVPDSLRELTTKSLEGARICFFNVMMIIVSIAMCFNISSRRRNNLTIVTTERFIHLEGGFFGKKLEFYLSNIGRVEAKQTLFERLLSSGQLTIYDKVLIHGSKKLEKKHKIEVTGIAEPNVVKKEIINLMDSHGKWAAKMEEQHKSKKPWVK